MICVRSVCWIADLDKQEWKTASDARIAELRANARKLRDRMILAIGAAVNDSMEREKLVENVPTIESLMEKGLQDAEKELAEEEKSDHLLKVPKTRNRRANKSGKVRPDSFKKIATVDELSSEDEELLKLNSRRKSNGKSRRFKWYK